MPQPASAFGVNDSTIPSAHSIARHATSRPRRSVRSRPTLILPALKSPKKWLLLIPGMPSRNGGISRSTPGGLDDSILITVAPHHARDPPAIGPAPTPGRAGTPRPAHGAVPAAAGADPGP